MRRVPVLGDPTGVLALHVRQQPAQETRVTKDFVRPPDRRAVPVAVAARLRAYRLEPVARKVVDDAAVVEPADFLELVAQWTADGAIRARPEWPVDEFREGVASLG